MTNTQTQTADPNRSSALQAEYRLRFSATEWYRQAVWKVLCETFFSRFIRSTDEVLDLGSGWGEFVNNIRAARKHAMDLNPDAKARLSGDVRFHHQDCSKRWNVPADSRDAVFTSNFLEDLSDKILVEKTLAEAFRCLRPGGVIVCLGPNIRFLPGSYWDFWDHFVPLTDASLREVLTLAGFTVETVVPRFLPYSMSTGRTPPLWAVRLYLFLPFVWPVIGRQFLVVGRKP